MTREQSKSPKGMKPNPGPKASKKSKPMAKQAKQLAKQGRMGDSMLVHMNPQEVNGIASLSPMGLTKNPQTGLPEAFLPFLFAPAMAAAAPAAMAAVPAAAGVAAAAAPAAMGAGALGAGALGAAAPVAAGSALSAAAPAAAAGSTLASGAAAAPIAAEAAGAGLSTGIGSGLSSGAATGAGSAASGTAPLAAEAASALPSMSSWETGIGAFPEAAGSASSAPSVSQAGGSSLLGNLNPIGSANAGEFAGTGNLLGPTPQGAYPTNPTGLDKALGADKFMPPTPSQPTPDVLAPKIPDRLPGMVGPSSNTPLTGSVSPNPPPVSPSSPPSVTSPMSGTANPPAVGANATPNPLDWQNPNMMGGPGPSTRPVTPRLPGSTPSITPDPPSVNTVTSSRIPGSQNGLPLDDPFNTAVNPPSIADKNPLLPPVPEPGANMIAKPPVTLPDGGGIGTLPNTPQPGLSAPMPPKPPAPPLSPPMSGPTGGSPVAPEYGPAPTRMGPIAPTRLATPATMPGQPTPPGFMSEGPIQPIYNSPAGPPMGPDPVASSGIGPLSPSPNIPPAGPTAPTPPGSIPPTGPGSTPNPSISSAPAAPSTSTNNGLFGTGISGSTLMQGMIPAMMMSQMMQQPMRPMKEEGGGRKGSGSYAEGSWEPDFNNDKNSTAEHNYFPNKEYKITPKTGSAKKKAQGGPIDTGMKSGIGGFNNQNNQIPQMGAPQMGSPQMAPPQNFSVTPYNRSQEPQIPNPQGFKGFMNGMQNANNPFKYMMQHMGPPTHAGIQRRNMGGGIGNFNQPAAFNGGGMVNSPEKELIYKAQSILEGKVQDNGELGMYIQTYGPDSLRDLAKRMASGGQVNSNRQSTQEPHYLNGPGDGMTDSIPAQAGQQDVILSDGEYIIPADVVSGLGNGSSNAGARRLNQMVQELRQYRTGTTKQPKQIDPKQVMP